MDDLFVGDGNDEISDVCVQLKSLGTYEQGQQELYGRVNSTTYESWGQSINVTPWNQF